MKHHLVPEAAEELQGIWHDVADQSGTLEIADRLIESLTERFRLLSQYPYRGRLRPKRSRGVLSFPVAECVIVY